MIAMLLTLLLMILIFVVLAWAILQIPMAAEIRKTVTIVLAVVLVLVVASVLLGWVPYVPIRWVDR